MQTLIATSEIILIFVMIVYFVSSISSKSEGKQVTNLDSEDKLEELKQLQSISLSEPLSEKARPKTFDDIIGQENGIRALRAALCGENPQHVLIYGPPGIGKTCAARLVLEEAKHSDGTPFKENAPFIEVDATCMRFDERSIADPLMGSVHDPIYQGAGAYGRAGLPQPKPGAVTKAHGGVLFLDEIGELHPIQINKLLKVLEDRCVHLDSAYYSKNDKTTTQYLREVFEKGLPADFRLVGATTRNPNDIPAAIRSRCVEIFFNTLTPANLETIAVDAAKKGGRAIEQNAAKLAAAYSSSGRDVVNIIQLACGLASNENRSVITEDDIAWIAETGRFSYQVRQSIPDKDCVGCVNGLGVADAGVGFIIRIEAIAKYVGRDKGSVFISGFAESEERGRENKIVRKSMAKGSIENALTVLECIAGINVRDYSIHINIPGGMPVDGPSAGIAIVAALYSAISGIPIDRKLAFTGEISLTGEVLPVGGITSKLQAALESGVKTVYMPAGNTIPLDFSSKLKIIKVKNVNEITALFENNCTDAVNRL